MLQTLAPYLAVAAVVLLIALAIVLIVLFRSLRKLRADQRAVLGNRERRDLVAHSVELEAQVQNLREATAILTTEVEAYRRDLDGSLSNIAVVRFDAFRDTGGQQSTSVAMLDRYRSGVVLSVIMSREFSRLYTKYLDHGVPDRELAPEEAAAVERAVPHPLRRGELSHSPVPSLPRDLRPEPGDDHPRPQTLTLSHDETEDMTDAAPQDREALGQTHLDVGGDDWPEPPAAGTAEMRPGAAGRETAPAAAVTEMPETPAAGDEPAAEIEARPAQEGDEPATETDDRPAADGGDEAAPTSAAETAAPRPLEPQAEDGYAGATPPGPRERRRRGADDWLGGDELDF